MPTQVSRNKISSDEVCCEMRCHCCTWKCDYRCGFESYLDDVENHEAKKCPKRPGVPQLPDTVYVKNCVEEAAVLNGTYNKIGTYSDLPHWSKNGRPYTEPDDSFKENLQVWWNAGAWRIGVSGDPWFTSKETSPFAKAWISKNSRGAPATITVAATREDLPGTIYVANCLEKAAVLNGTYKKIGIYNNLPHWSKNGRPYTEPNDGFKENLQVWWNAGAWRIGVSGDPWFTSQETSPFADSWISNNSRGAPATITIAATLKTATAQVEDNEPDVNKTEDKRGYPDQATSDVPLATVHADEVVSDLVLPLRAGTGKKIGQALPGGTSIAFFKYNVTTVELNEDRSATVCNSSDDRRNVLRFTGTWDEVEPGRSFLLKVARKTEEYELLVTRDGSNLRILENAQQNIIIAHDTIPIVESLQSIESLRSAA